jgi:hypothetical protein
MDILSLVSVVCCQVEVSVTSWSLSRGDLPNVVSKKCDCEASKKKMRQPRPPRGCRAIGKKYITKYMGEAIKLLSCTWEIHTPYFGNVTGYPD